MQDCPRGLGAVPGGEGNTDELEHDSIFSKNQHSKNTAKNNTDELEHRHRHHRHTDTDELEHASKFSNNS